MRRVLVSLVAGLLLAAGCGQPTAQTPRPGGGSASGWGRLPDSPLDGRTGATLVALDDRRVLVAGGWEWFCPPNADCAFPETPMLRDAAVLDIETGEWQVAADAPFGLTHVAGALVGTDVYLLTGCRAGPGCDGPPELLRYDVEVDAWEALGPAPAGRHWGLLQPVGDRLLMYAQSDEGGERPDHLFDPATGEWEELPDDPLPPTYDRFAFTHRGRLLVFGSPQVAADEEGEAKVGAAYDLRTRTWTRLPDAPGHGYQVWRSGADAWLNPHYGEQGGGVLELSTDTWRAFPDDPFGWSWQGDMAGVVGEDGATYEYDAGWVRDTRNDAWLHVPERPGHAYDESLTAVGDSLVVFGGQTWGDPDDQDREGRLLSETWVWRPPA